MTPRFPAWEILDSYLGPALSSDPGRARTGTRRLFRDLIEPLGDSFLVRDRRLQQQLLARIVTRVRRLPEAQSFHEGLDRVGLEDEDAVVDRARRLAGMKTPALPRRVKRVLVPSRVTLGADLLLAGPIVRTCLDALPNAEIVFLGSRKNARLIAPDSSRFRIRELSYPRRGSLLERMLAWVDVAAAVSEETLGLSADRDLIVINPDSRFLQSGLLPLFPPGREAGSYFGWDPSVSGKETEERSQLEDLNRWLREMFRSHPRNPLRGPSLHLEHSVRRRAQEMMASLNLGRDPVLVGMNLGVGGNPDKRIHRNRETVSDFERLLVTGLPDQGATLVLDAGMGRDELEQARQLYREIGERGHGTARIEGGRLLRDDPGTLPVRLVLFQGPVDEFGALLEQCRIYVGYDSLGQHLAGALNLDLVTVFGGHASPLFARRWKPGGSGRIRVIESGPGPFDTRRQSELAGKVLAEARSLL
ncbi:MAG: hypothetical protein OXH11_14735 [Candidatus Aminicenantes bacterium]|nr:hypothetical protein [Candidatus Aminicenantes bacterium]